VILSLRITTTDSLKLILLLQITITINDSGYGIYESGRPAGRSSNKVRT